MSRKTRHKRSAAAAADMQKGKQSPIADPNRGGGRVQRAPSSNTVMGGVHGQNIISGVIRSNEREPSLRGRSKYKTFSDMVVNATIVGNGVRYFLNLVGKAKWRAEPADDSAEAQEYASRVQTMMDDMATPWHRVVRRAALYRYYGFDVQEWSMERAEEGWMKFKDVQVRPQSTIERWDVEDDGTIRGVIQRSPQTNQEIYLSRSRLIYMVDDALNDSPEGVGLFRHLVEPIKRLRKYLQLESWGYENDLRGVPIVRAPLLLMAQLVNDGTITQAQHDAILNPLKELIDVHARNPEMGLMIDSQTWQTADEAQRPSGMPQFDVALLDGGNYSLEEVHNAIMRTNMECARLLGIEHLLLGADGVGSLALAKDKSDNFALTVDGALNEIQVVMQRDFIGPLWLVNGWPNKLKPKLHHEQITNRDITRIAEALTSLAEIGIVLSRQDQAVTDFLDLIGLPGLKAIEEVDPELAQQLKIKAGAEQSADSKAQAEAAKESAKAKPKPTGDAK